jgi:4-hydroxy-tetrahydrodipicolinate synthase
MVIPRVLSRGSAPAAQLHHFSAILEAGDGLPSVIYNSPYYGFETKADLFFALHAKYPHLIGFKEFGSTAAMSYAAEHIVGQSDKLTLMVGVDTGVFHGYVYCGARGAITGIGNVLPREVLHLVALCEKAQSGDVTARRKALELEAALKVLSTFDEGADLVLYYKYLMVLEGNAEYERHFIATDALSASQKHFASTHLALFKSWYAAWSAAG